MTDKKLNDVQKSLQKMEEVVEKMKQEAKDKRIAERHKEDEDSMNAVQWTDWDFKG